MSTKIPTRLAILTALCNVLKNPTPGEDGDTFGVLTVYRGRAILGDDIKVDPNCLAILESPISDPAVQYAGVDYEMRRDKLTLLIQGRAPDTMNDSVDLVDQSSDVAYYLEAAVESRLARIQITDRNGEAVYPIDYALGGLILDLEIGSPVVRPPEVKLSATAFFFLPVRVGIAKQSDQPYTVV